MRVAVVGASGFVGATLVERLLGHGTDVRALIHSSGGAWRLSRHGIPLHAFDLLSPAETAHALEGCTHVVDCSRGTRALMFEGLQNLLDASRAARVERFVHVSSVAVYGDPIDLSGFPAETRLAHHKKCADLFCERISALMDEEKRIRSEVTAASPARGRLGR